MTARGAVPLLASGGGAKSAIHVDDLAGLLGAAAAWMSGGRIPDLAQALAVLRAPCTVDASAAAHDLGVRFRPSGDALEAMGRRLAGA